MRAGSVISCNTNGMAKTLKDLSAAVELEATQSGADAAAELACFRAYYRLARQLTDAIVPNLEDDGVAGSYSKSRGLEKRRGTH